MACWRPLTFNVPFSRGSSLKKEVKVPCNYCLSCRLTRSIYLRSISSYEAYMCALEGRGSSFSTLTYFDYFFPFVPLFPFPKSFFLFKKVLLSPF